MQCALILLAGKTCVTLYQIDLFQVKLFAFSPILWHDFPYD